MLSLHNGGPGISEAVLAYTRDFHTIDPRRLHVMAQGPAQFGQWSLCHGVFVRRSKPARCCE